MHDSGVRHVTMIGTKRSGSASPQDWELGFDGRLSVTEIHRRAQALLRRYTHVKVFSGKQLLTEVHRPNGAAGSTATVPTSRSSESVLCEKCRCLVKAEKLAAHLALHASDSGRTSAKQSYVPKDVRTAEPQNRMVGDLQARVQRDHANAVHVQTVLRGSAAPLGSFTPIVDLVHGASRSQFQVADQLARETVSRRLIASRPFDAMVEAEVTTDRTRSVVWYAHRDTSTNEKIGDVQVQTWTHPVIQIGLSRQLGSSVPLKSSGYLVRNVRPLARARYRAVLPEISGLYDPGGEINIPPGIPARAAAGLKAVKLDMTPEQVEAFLGRMNGVLMITGVPGTGKTTVAFQRIRFLFDQQDLQEDRDSLPRYEPRLTRVFLASRNLIEYSTHLLRDELSIPKDVVSYVPDFVAQYVDSVWQPKVDARPRQRRLSRDDERAREAMFNLAKAEDLAGVWRTFEAQVRDRLPLTAKGEWFEYARRLGEPHATDAEALSRSLATAVPAAVASDPIGSKIRMDALWLRVRRDYVACRSHMREAERNSFDGRFARWLLWVYDPLDVLLTYFSGRQNAGKSRIRSGTAGLIDPDAVVQAVLADLQSRVYGPEQLAWIAWLLRFALPEEADATDGFREVQRAIPHPDHPTERRWTHVVLDEAQDLSVQEASLLASLIHPRGALTVSADYHQVVSPVHGMTDGEALKFGLPIWDRTLHMQYSFNRNLRQSREIGQFLFDFHQQTFGEIPKFEPGDRAEGIKPALYTTPRAGIPALLRQMYAALARSQSIKRVAVIQIDDDAAELAQLRSSLERLGVRLAAIDETLAEGALVTTSVERAKGLEFDACIVLGLDDVERASLNFAKNRAYVALSRPTQRLFMVSEHFPPLLQRMRRDLFEYQSLTGL